MQQNAQEVACGQCNDCRIEKAREWATRAMHEAQMHPKNCFITLTYNNEHVPKDGSLRLEEWQAFAQRLRKAQGPFRYMHVGEYGEENRRPHYHALIFGLDFSEDRAIWTEDEATGRRYYRSPLLAKLWPKGFHDVQDMSREAANYVSQYAVKKIMGTSVEADERRSERYGRYDPQTGEYWEVAEETWTMSNRPGIGEAWFKKYHTDLFPADHCVVKGKEQRVPRYYTKLLKIADSDLHARVKDKRRARAKERAAENTPARRKDRAAITARKISARTARKLD